MLQKMPEDVEYSELLDTVRFTLFVLCSTSNHNQSWWAESSTCCFELNDCTSTRHMQGLTFPAGSTGRMLYIAAFAVSGYASTAGRTNKPFNPLLGETYELVYPEKVHLSIHVYTTWKSKY